jgi:predicted nucleic acid-binding Zn finger protein
MKIQKQKEGIYKVESASTKGKFYTVDVNKPFCSCLGYIYYARRKGGVCKHIQAVQELIAKKKTKKGSSPDKIIEDVKKKGEIESIILIEQYGEEAVNELIKRGELIEVKGKIKLLE